MADTGQSQVSSLFSADTLNGRVGSVAVRQPAGISQPYTLEQTGSLRPIYSYDQTVNRPTIEFSASHRLMLGVPQDITNPGYIEVIMSTASLRSNQSSGTAGSNNNARIFGEHFIFNGGSVFLLGQRVGRGNDQLGSATPRVWRFKISRGPSYGPTQLIVDDQVVASVDHYRTEINQSDQEILGRLGAPSAKMYSFQLHIGELIGDDLQATMDAHKQFAGIAV